MLIQSKIGYDQTFKMIAVTGGPCAGKSTFMAQTKSRLEERGYRVFVLSETVTELINAGIVPWDEWKDDTAFQENVLAYQIEREERYYAFAQSLSAPKQTVMLCDRGVLDGAAYIDRGSFLTALERTGWVAHELLERYAAVIHLVTAAKGAAEFYTLENNRARTETAEQATALDDRTYAAWNNHHHHIVIDNSLSFGHKMLRAQSSLARVLNMPRPLEKERKFLIHSFDPAMIPEGAVAVEITQEYLTDTLDAGERRVRSRRIDGGTSYYYTEKTETVITGVREEVERLITFREYEEYRKCRDPKSKTIKKTRYAFKYAERHLELDVYHEPTSNLVVLEIEVADINEEVDVPAFWKFEEVTGNKRYSNREIARGSLDM